MPFFLFIVTFLSEAPVFFATTMIKFANYKPICSPIPGKNPILDKLYLFVSWMNIILYPQIFQITLTIMLGIRLFKLAHQRKSLISSQRGRQLEKQENAMKKSAIMVFVILIANPSCWLPSVIVWVSMFILGMLPNPPIELSYKLGLISQILLALVVLAHSWNLFIYIWKIPNCFQEVLARLHLQKILLEVISNSKLNVKMQAKTRFGNEPD